MLSLFFFSSLLSLYFVQVLGKQHGRKDRKPALMEETINQQMRNKQSIRNFARRVMRKVP